MSPCGTSHFLRQPQTFEAIRAAIPDRKFEREIHRKNEPFWLGMQLTDKSKFMKTTVLIFGLLIGGAALAAPAAPAAVTNPALIYWQALMEVPDISAEEQVLLDNFRDAPLDKRYESLVHRYDAALRLVSKAAKMTNSPCEWGIDMADGPDTLLPHLYRAKAVTRGAQMRARFFLNQKNEQQVISDLAGSFVLGRHLATDGILISALVQIAIESIVVQTVAENFFRFSDTGLESIVATFDAAPARGTIARSLSYGERTLVAWFARKIVAIREKHSTEAAALAEIRELLAEKTAETKNYKKADHFLEAADGKIDRLIAFIDAADGLYDEMERIAGLKYNDFVRVNQEFFDRIEQSSNPFVANFFPALQKSQEKEFAVRSRIEKVRAAVQYRLQGDQAIQGIRDPLGDGPFRMRPFSFEGVDRGFELISPHPVESPDRMVFVEKAGKPFQVIGIHAGEAFTKR
jgi:hypothetical protein